LYDFLKDNLAKRVDKNLRRFSGSSLTDQDDDIVLSDGFHDGLLLRQDGKLFSTFLDFWFSKKMKEILANNLSLNLSKY